MIHIFGDLPMKLSGKSPVWPLLLLAAASSAHASFRVFDITNSDMKVHRETGRAYIVRPTTAAPNVANTLAEINLSTGAIVRQVFLGNDPLNLELSSTGSTAIVNFRDVGAFTRVNMETFQASPLVSHGLSQFGSPMFGTDISFSPGSEDTFAISRFDANVLADIDVAVFDGLVRRPTVAVSRMGSIEFGRTADRIYGLDTGTTAQRWQRLNVNSQGASIIGTIPGLSGTGVTGFKMFNDMAVFSNGRVVDAETGTLLATLNLSGIASGALVETDVLRNRVYILSGTSTTRTLSAFDMTDFTRIGTFTFTGVQGIPRSLVQFGGDGIGFRTNTQVFAVNTALVPEPTTLTALGLALAATLRKRQVRSLSTK